MPRGIPNSGKRNMKPADGGAVTQAPTGPTATVPGVREQVKQMSGFASIEELRAAVPESTATPVEPKTRKPRTPRVEETDPLMNDPKYRQAIGNMTAFGGKKAVTGSFAVAASALKDERLRLNEEEEQTWDEFFYVVSKRSTLDPSSPWFLVAYAIVMLLMQVGTRMWERSGYSGLFAMFDKMTPKKKENARPVAPVSENVA